jgi:hypothetical protein
MRRIENETQKFASHGAGGGTVVRQEILNLLAHHNGAWCILVVRTLVFALLCIQFVLQLDHTLPGKLAGCTGSFMLK